MLQQYQNKKFTTLDMAVAWTFPVVQKNKIAIFLLQSMQSI